MNLSKTDLVDLNPEQILLLLATLDLDEPLEPRRPLLYLFQHVALREAAFENHGYSPTTYRARG